MSTVEVRGLGYTCGTKKILEDVDWKIEPKEHWLLMGANGSGKTTLASILCGYHGYTEGKVFWQNRLVSAEGAEEMRKEIGFVSSSYFERCLKLENGLNIVLGAYYGQLVEREAFNDKALRQAMKLLKLFGIKQKGQYPFDLLSKGQRQKILLCRAFMRPFKLIILDEPLSGLDFLSQAIVFDLLEAIVQREQSQIVYITHQAQEVLPFFTHVLLLKDGKVYLQGEKRQVLTSDNLSGFMGQAVECCWKDDGTVSFQRKRSGTWSNIFGEV